MKHIPKFTCIMTIAAFVCFLLAYGFLMLFTILPPYKEALALLIPAAVLGLITLFVYLGILPESTADILTCILSVLFIFTSIFYTFVIGIYADVDGTDDIRYYERLYHRLEDRPGMEYFPDEVPESEGEILFSWNPQFLQGSERFEITFTPDAQTYEQYRITFPAKAQWYGNVKDSPVYANNYKDGTLYLFFWDGDFNHMEASYAVLHPDGAVTFYYTNG